MDALSAVAAACAVAATGCWAWAWLRRRRTSKQAAPNDQTSGRSTEPMRSVELAGSGPGWLRVVGAADLLATVHADATLAHLCRQSRLAPEVFKRDFCTAVERYAEFVQLMPASEAHHHAHAGGLLAHALEMTLAALTWRTGMLLPQGAQAELVDQQRDHWTYVVFFATLLHDVGKPMADLRILWRKPGSTQELRWMPLAGSLVDCGASEYRVGFAPKAERDYGTHQRLAVTLLQRIAPASALSFIATVPEAMEALTRVLGGGDRDGAVATLLRRADQASVSHALMHGSRARFASSVRVPLVELLMQALRDLLRRGGAMPLNRDGAIGWVYDGSVWFVAKRLADTVRTHLQEHAPDEAVPGDTKNDRLFDTWQEYGCLTINPATGQAIWYVNVHGEDSGGYSHRLTMLRFPLQQLWDDPAQFPKTMAGRIEVLAGRTAEREAPAASPAPALPFVLSDAEARIDTDAAASPARRSKASAAPVPAPKFAVDKGGAGAPPLRPPPAARGGVQASAPQAADDDGLLESDEDAQTEAKRSSAVRRARSVAPPHALPAPASPAPAAGSSDTAPGPVVLPTGLPRLSRSEEGAAGREPSEVAVTFLRWLQERLASREIHYNEAGAPVHFVPQGMALVSPLIFREFARQGGAPGLDLTPERLGLDVQREVLNAGWHVPAEAGKNIHQFAVSKRGGAKPGRLAAVVLAEPQRWVYPVPPANPALAPWVPSE
jgi:integrating conjugative element relaxase (TIGR03760 family)